ncbi:MAG TPA: hypothetical protein VGN63_19590 [Flavisolibacter sp.]|jgi:hypothetical protein|nr:hypothetical protein [Flavisolibacter sp.]
MKRNKQNLTNLQVAGMGVLNDMKLIESVYPDTRKRKVKCTRIVEQRLFNETTEKAYPWIFATIKELELAYRIPKEEKIKFEPTLKAAFFTVYKN